MTLIQLQYLVNSLVVECIQKGIKPETVEVISRNTSSDALTEIDSGKIESADENVDYMFGIPVGNTYAEIQTS